MTFEEAKKLAQELREATTVAIRKLPGGTGALALRYFPSHNVAKRTVRASQRLKAQGFAEAVQEFRALTERVSDPAFRDYSQSAHLSPKVKPGLRRERLATRDAGRKVVQLRKEFPKQSSQEIPSPLPGYIKSKDVAEKYRGQLHDRAVKRLKKV